MALPPRAGSAFNDTIVSRMAPAMAAPRARSGGSAYSIAIRREVPGVLCGRVPPGPKPSP
jgi:hypothetical protein